MAAFRSFHDWRPIIEAEPVASRDVLIDQMLNTPFVVRRDNMIIQTNEFGQAYSCMDQGDAAVVCLRFARDTGRAKYRDLGEKLLRVITTSIDEGGLRRNMSWGTFWFHGRTGRDKRAKGWVLNKHLHACRSLLDAYDAVDGKMPMWADVAIRGLLELSRGAAPLDTFIVGGRSWLYYALDGDVGRFLEHPTKNGDYHLYCMSLIARMALKHPDEMVKVKWPRTVLNAYNNKLYEGLYVNSTPMPLGNFTAVSEGKEPLDADVLNYWQQNT